MALKSELNPQDVLINSTEGIFLTDAGAGTGKTYAIVRRYGKLIDKKISPEKILLITFTKNAAEQMKDEVISNLFSRVSISRLLEAPIMTFHSFCTKVLKTAGLNSPSYLGLSENLSGNFKLLEENSFEHELFSRFFNSFSVLHSKDYSGIIQSLQNKQDDVLRIIKKLCSLGIFPNKKGWNESDLEKLKGNFEIFSREFDNQNEFKIKEDGNEKQNVLYKKFDGNIKDKLHDDFDKEKIFSGKSVNPDCKAYVFSDGIQEELIEFIRRVYISYIEFLLGKNFLNFEFLVMFAYLSLLNNHFYRKKIQFEYVMVDEFQDTDEIQFKLILLLCKNMNGKINLCVVGDWKQGIYGFRNTSIKNITEFSEYMGTYKDELNSKDNILDYDLSNNKRIMFENNYRSSDALLKFSTLTLRTKATKGEELDTEYVDLHFKNPLKAMRDLNDLTEINFYACGDKLSEYNLIISKISELVNDTKKYRIREFGKDGNITGERSVRYSDICVLSRKKNFCLEFQRESLRQGIPVNYTGGLDIFLSEQGILVLAWLKLILNSKDISAWLPVLDKECFSYPEIQTFKRILEENTKKDSLYGIVPDEELGNFLRHLKNIPDNLPLAAGTVLRRYMFNDAVSSKIIEVITEWLEADLLSLSELIKLIERTSDTEFNIDYGNIPDAVITQTIHKSKGLEYPVVIIANVNERSFPDTKGEQGVITYMQNAGLRIRSYFSSKDKYYYKFDNWHADFINSVFKNTDYDEERRLLYVAATRAKQYLFFTSYKPSPFFTGLSESSKIPIIEDFTYPLKILKTEEKLKSIIINPVKKVFAPRKFISVHSLMETAEENNFQEYHNVNEFTLNSSLQQKERGILIHQLAHKLASGIEVESDLEEIRKIKKFLYGLKAESIMAEVNFLFPKDNDVVRGIIDLIAFYKDRIVIYDYKTDSGKSHLDKYKLQVLVYKEVLQNIYKDKQVQGKIYFVNLDEFIEV